MFSYPRNRRVRFRGAGRQSMFRFKGTFGRGLFSESARGEGGEVGCREMGGSAMQKRRG